MARFAVVLVLALGALAAVAWAALDDTGLVSRASGPSGAKADQPATLGNVSGDGSRVVFWSMADNLSDEDIVENGDVYVRDTAAATTTLASRATGPAGAPSDNSSFDGRISADGRRVGFVSEASNLSEDDQNSSSDVFVRDLEAETTTLASRADGPGGAVAVSGATEPSISADGRYVAFVSNAPNLPGGTDIHRVFVRDLAAGKTTLVSVGSDGEARGGRAPSISADGRRVAFTTFENIDPDDEDSAEDVYVRDLGTGTTSLATRATGNADASGTEGQISGNGRFVSFASFSPNLGGPSSGAIYVRDLEAQTTTLASRATGAAGAPGDTEIPGGSSISHDGRSVAFAAHSANLHPDDTDTDFDVFLRDLGTATTTLVSRASGATGAPGDGSSTPAAISADGMFVAFQSSAPNLHPDDTDRLDDVFVRQVREPPPEPPIIVEPPAPPPPPVVIAGPPPPPPAPQPVAGRREMVQPVRGRVRVRVRGTRRFVRLRAGRLLPDRSEIDTTNGVARIVVAAVRDGSATASALVSRGRAIVDQNRARRPTTTLRLSERLSCARTSGASSAQKKKRKKRRRLFTETDGGRFRTRGGFGSAAASGTAWLTTDRCNSTRIGVREGTVRVRDRGRRRTVTVRAGSKYTARRRAARRP